MEGCQLVTEQANNSVDIVRFGPVWSGTDSVIPFSFY